MLPLLVVWPELRRGSPTTEASTAIVIGEVTFASQIDCKRTHLHQHPVFWLGLIINHRTKHHQSQNLRCIVIAFIVPHSQPVANEHTA